MTATRAFAALAFTLAIAGPAGAQTAPADPPCVARQAGLGGIGQAGVVAFTGAISGEHVCATVANVAIDGFSAQLAPAPAPGALVSAAVTTGGDVTFELGGATLTGVGPYVVTPGGGFPSSGSDLSDEPRVILAYAGQRVLLIATTPVELVDLTRILRDRPDLFGADAVERAIVIASGPSAALSLRTGDGPLGADSIATPLVLSLVKRG